MGDITDTVGTDAPHPNEIGESPSAVEPPTIGALSDITSTPTTESNVKPSLELLKEAHLQNDIDSSIGSPHSTVTVEAIVKNKSISTPTVKDIDASPRIEKLSDTKSEARNNDIFAANNKRQNNSSTIFSVGGAPSKTVHNGLDGIDNKSSQVRNPVTGFGVSSNDEFKNKPPKRKDGNPVLGVGYKDKEATSTRRVPPGGYSNGIW